GELRHGRTRFLPAPWGGVSSLPQDELLERFAVADCAGRYPAALSAGDKQRVAAVRALVNRPDVVVADQPTR
ncbi:ATP-binding cassette domain-containing protein, partial [Natronococcus sp. JC468]|uniref:ATP-binding cassette domain-containing protein n=1 Tax=Natronococcus sp. JC468 TaxID=1961921 RepID=UPI00143AE463